MENITNKRIGHEIIRLEEIESTNTLIMQTPEYLLNHGLVVVADHQTAGRGRIGRKWASVPGKQLQFSAVLHPTVPKEQIPVMSLMVAVVVAEAMEKLLGLAPVLKWPNDILLNEKKVCGILLELKTLRPKEPLLVVGIGLNCFGPVEEFPEEIREQTTTLEVEAGKTFDRETMLSDIMDGLERWFQKLVQGERGDLVNAWRSRANLEGCRVRFPTSRGPEEGDVQGVSDEGFLLVKTADGEGWALSSGELEWLT